MGSQAEQAELEGGTRRTWAHRSAGVGASRTDLAASWAAAGAVVLSDAHSFASIASIPAAGRCSLKRVVGWAQKSKKAASLLQLAATDCARRTLYQPISDTCSESKAHRQAGERWRRETRRSQLVGLPENPHKQHQHVAVLLRLDMQTSGMQESGVAMR